MARVSGVKEKVHLPLYDAFVVGDGKTGAVGLRRGLRAGGGRHRQTGKQPGRARQQRLQSPGDAPRG